MLSFIVFWLCHFKFCRWEGGNRATCFTQCCIIFLSSSINHARKEAVPCGPYASNIPYILPLPLMHDRVSIRHGNHEAVGCCYHRRQPLQRLRAGIATGVLRNIQISNKRIKDSPLSVPGIEHQYFRISLCQKWRHICMFIKASSLLDVVHLT